MRPHHKSSTSNISQAPQWRPKNTQNNQLGKPRCFTRASGLQRASSSSNIMHLMGKRCGGIPGKGRRRRTSARRWGSRPIGRARHREASGKLTLDRIEQKGNRAGFNLQTGFNPADRWLGNSQALRHRLLRQVQRGSNVFHAAHAPYNTQSIVAVNTPCTARPDTKFTGEAR
jgi:hypothetical protein